MYERFRETAVATFIAITVCSSGTGPESKPFFCVATGTGFQGPDTVFGLLTKNPETRIAGIIIKVESNNPNFLDGKRVRLGDPVKFDETICAVSR